MIEFVDIIDQPYSGEFEERIYDIQSSWNSQSWTYVKFINADNSEWCGVFRGNPRKVAISKTRGKILVLTSDYIWILNSTNGEVIQSEDKPSYKNLTVAPNGDFILADYYSISRIEGTLKGAKHLQSPIQMDMIKFKSWKNEKLIIECDEFMNWERHLILELDSSKWTIKIKNAKSSYN